MIIKDPKYSYIQDSDNCRIYALLHAYSYVVDQEVEPLKVIKEMKDKNKTLINMLLDGDLGEKVEIKRFNKSTPSNLIEHFKIPMSTSIVLYKEINYSRRIIKWGSEKLTHRGFHEIFVYGFDFKTNRVLFLNSWEKDQRQEMSFDLFFHCLRYYFLIYKMKNLELNEISPLSQVDNRWKNVRIGRTNNTIGRYGCLITSICMLMGRLRGEPANPADGARYWKFNKKGEMLWSSTEFRGIDYMGKGKFSLQNCKDWTTNKKGCVIKVVNKKIPEHFAVCNKVVGDRIQIIDPIDGKTKFLDSTDYRAVDLRLFISEK
jgi:hypothetical protein